MTTQPAILEPDLPIIDPHHHLYTSNHWSGGEAYLLPEFARDLGSGHNVVATVYAECGTLNRTTGPDHLRPSGEAAFVAVVARLAESGHFGPTRVAEGYIGHADLMMSEVLGDSLAGQAEASEGRLRGIRSSATWDADAGLAPGARPFGPPRLMAESAFRASVRVLAQHKLVYDAWQYYPQLGELAELAAAAPDTTIVCGHCGGLVGTRGYATDDNFDNWKSQVTELALQPNIVMKVGGLAHDRTGFGLRARDPKPDEAELVALWRPYVETCIEAFGVDRCMFESNFPVDSVATSYRSLWNVFKRIAQGCSPAEKSLLFAGTARRVYRLS